MQIFFSFEHVNTHDKCVTDPPSLYLNSLIENLLQIPEQKWAGIETRIESVFVPLMFGREKYFNRTLNTDFVCVFLFHIQLL